MAASLNGMTTEQIFKAMKDCASETIKKIPEDRRKEVAASYMEKYGVSDVKVDDLDAEGIDRVLRNGLLLSLPMSM